MSYAETIAWLYALDRRKGMDFRLQRLMPVLADLGDPQLSFPSIHIAGTNGKGSTAAMLESVYRRGGYCVGMYTSPHLLSFCERIRVDGRCIPQDDVVRQVASVRQAMQRVGEELTFFEIATLAAFLEFAESDLDLAVLEAGLGGRLDATNVVRSVACAITSIDLDHCEYLGSSLSEIATEKAGIVKAGVPLITGPLPPPADQAIGLCVETTASRWLRYGKDFGPSGSLGLAHRDSGALVGVHQSENRAVATAVIGVLAERFPLAAADVEAGLAATRWPGRLEVVAGTPTVVLDAAHNPGAVRYLVAALADMDLSRPCVLVFGVMVDKDWRRMLVSLAPAFDAVVLVPVDTPRSLDPADALELARTNMPWAQTACSAMAGLAVAKRRAGEGGTVVVSGSIFLVAELYTACVGEEQPFANAC